MMAAASKDCLGSEGDNAFGQLLKHWRSHRNFSQLALSMASDVSQRHISFLESGRAKPSRSMILQLATVLDIPLRQQNKLLTAAGFAPVYSEFDLSSPEVAPIRRAIDFTLKQQEPYPAFVMDRYWNQITMNQGAIKLFGWLMNGRAVPESVGANLMKLMLHPEGIRAQVENWDAIAPHLIHRVHRESLTESPDANTQSLFQEILTYPDIEALWRAPSAATWHLPLLTATFVQSKDRLSAQPKDQSTAQLSFFTTLTTLGTPQDITLQELRLECMFPADEETEQTFVELPCVI